MINMNSIMNFEQHTTQGVTTPSQQADNIQGIRNSYSVPNAWHDGSTNVQIAMANNELHTFDWDLIDQDTSLYEREGLEYALETKMQPLRFQG